MSQSVCCTDFGGLLNLDGSYKLPNQLYYISWKSDSSEFYLTEEEIGTYDTTLYDLVFQMPLESERQGFRLARVGGGEVTISLGELAGLAGNGVPPPPNPGSQDPYDGDLPDISDAPVPVFSYYVYDHLGNTRVVYTVDVSDICNGGDGIVYTLENVLDYYPYGKILRRHVGGSGEEKFLTTQHQRDEETGFDYRGARFYDGDIGRFLSLDPLSADYPTLSDYVYVADNPIIFIDPTGKSVDGSIYNLDGKYLGDDGEDNDDITILATNKNKRQYEKGKVGEVSSITLGQGTVNAIVAVENKTQDDKQGREIAALSFKGDSEPQLGRLGSKTRSSIPKPKAGKTNNDVEAMVHTHPTDENYEAIPSQGIDTKAFHNFEMNIIVGNKAAKRVESVPQPGGRPPLKVTTGSQLRVARFYDSNSKQIFTTVPVGTFQIIQNNENK